MPYWNGVTDREVLIVEPNKRLSYTWSASGDEAATGLKTVVTWIADTQAGRHARTHGAVGLPAGDERNYQGASYGWQRNITNLEKAAARL
jgi:uncharacterized protein YndB with AHSA1/START domain